MSDKLHPCCDPTSPSPIWEGKSTGKIISMMISKLTLPIPANPKSKLRLPRNKDVKRVILHLTEGHSIYFLNAQLLADSFATQLNCDVIMPDQFGGKQRVPVVAKLPHFPEGKEEVPSHVEGSDDTPPSIS